MVVTVSVAFFMWAAIFGNGSGYAITYDNLDEFSSVSFVQDCKSDIDGATRANVYIQTGDEFSITYDGVNGKETFEAEVADGELVVSLETGNDFLYKFFSSDSSSIYITIPESYDIQTVEIDAELGYFEISDITAETLNFDGGSTLVYIFDSSMKESDIAVDLGNIYAYDTDFGDFQFNGGTSNPELKNCTFSNFDFNLAFGNLLVSTAEIEEINMLVDMGYVDMSNITLAGDMNAYADYGAVVISLVGDPADFILDCYISESGKYYLDENLLEGKDESLQQLTIETYIGDIDVSFVE